MISLAYRLAVHFRQVREFSSNVHLKCIERDREREISQRCYVRMKFFIGVELFLCSNRSKRKWNTRRMYTQRTFRLKLFFDRSLSRNRLFFFNLYCNDRIGGAVNEKRRRSVILSMWKLDSCISLINYVTIKNAGRRFRSVRKNESKWNEKPGVRAHIFLPFKTFNRAEASGRLLNF